MVNNKLIAERIGEIIDENNLSASSFASMIGVQRSSISHILSGRNNPSLDLLLKIHKSFPDISLEWLILGEDKIDKSLPLTNNKDVTEIIKSDKESDNLRDSHLREIVYYYDDGSFERFFPKQ
ncbi:MAG: helix-turn-helix transcriptional regulator [Bacteroidota bacterium]|nr:helix-turn-helix transcriptional regulator [Bacteroidota bacterium]